MNGILAAILTRTLPSGSGGRPRFFILVISENLACAGLGSKLLPHLFPREVDCLEAREHSISKLSIAGEPKTYELHVAVFGLPPPRPKPNYTIPMPEELNSVLGYGSKSPEPREQVVVGAFDNEA